MTSVQPSAPAAPKSSARRILPAVLLLADLGVLIPAWFDGGGPVCDSMVGPLMLAFMGAFILLVFWHRWFVLYFFLNMALLFGLFMGIWHYRAKEIVFAENFCGRPVRIECDGAPWISLEDRETRQETLRMGAHELAVFDAQSGKELERIPASLDPRPFLGYARHYVLNVKGAMAYVIATYRYSTIPRYANDKDEKEPEEITERWFKPKAERFFEDAPESVQTYTIQGVPGFASLEILKRSPKKMNALAREDMRLLADAMRRWLNANRTDLIQWKSTHPGPSTNTTIRADALAPLEVSAERVREWLAPKFLKAIPETPWHATYRFYLNEARNPEAPFAFAIATPCQHPRDLDDFSNANEFHPADQMLWLDDDFFLPPPAKKDTPAPGTK